MKLKRYDARLLEETLTNKDNPHYEDALRQLRYGLVEWEHRHQACQQLCDIGAGQCSNDLVVC